MSHLWKAILYNFAKLFFKLVIIGSFPSLLKTVTIQNCLSASKKSSLSSASTPLLFSYTSFPCSGSILANVGLGLISPSGIRFGVAVQSWKHSGASVKVCKCNKMIKKTLDRFCLAHL